MHTPLPVYSALCLMLAGAMSAVHAEEYMKRGASVQDYEQALNRVMERKRGIVTGRERQAARQSEQTPKAARPTETQPTSAPRRAAPHAETSRTASARHIATTPKPDIYTPDPNQSADTSDGVSIYFGYNSAQLTSASRMELKKLGEALALPQFSEVSWLIEGHTDAAGTADYNQTLSEQRAQSAQRYLIEQCGIEPNKLIAVGKGKSDPYDRENPMASVNRRVRLRPAGG